MLQYTQNHVERVKKVMNHCWIRITSNAEAKGRNGNTKVMKYLSNAHGIVIKTDRNIVDSKPSPS